MLEKYEHHTSQIYAVAAMQLYFFCERYQPNGKYRNKKGVVPMYFEKSHFHYKASLISDGLISPQQKV